MTERAATLRDVIDAAGRVAAAHAAREDDHRAALAAVNDAMRAAAEQLRAERDAAERTDRSAP